MKSYTDISQSKKLAEILPIESADMYYSHEFVNSAGDYYKLNIASEGYFDDEESLGSDIPAWSLAALLELLPKRLEMEDDVYELSVYLYGLYYWNINNGNPCFVVKNKDNFVDACYKMILKLHELNLL